MCQTTHSNPRTKRRSSTESPSGTPCASVRVSSDQRAGRATQARCRPLTDGSLPRDPLPVLVARILAVRPIYALCLSRRPTIMLGCQPDQITCMTFCCRFRFRVTGRPVSSLLKVPCSNYCRNGCWM